MPQISISPLTVMIAEIRVIGHSNSSSCRKFCDNWNDVHMQKTSMSLFFVCGCLYTQEKPDKKLTEY